MDRNRKLSDHFTLYEMMRSETAERKGIDNTPPEDQIPKLQSLCNNILEPVRAHFGQPFRPNSGYRSLDLNAAVGGSTRSQHCLAEAVDIEIPGVSNYDLAYWIWNNLGFDQVILECYTPGIPNSGWVHVSRKEEPGHNRHMALTYGQGKYQEGLTA